MYPSGGDGGGLGDQLLDIPDASFFLDSENATGDGNPGTSNLNPDWSPMTETPTGMAPDATFGLMDSGNHSHKPSDQSISSPTELLQKLHDLGASMSSMLEQLRLEIRQLSDDSTPNEMDIPNNVAGDILSTRIQEVQVQIEWAITQLDGLFASSLIQPHEVTHIYVMQAEFGLLEKQLMLFSAELSQLATGTLNPLSLLQLVIVKQPFPLSIKQNKQLDNNQAVEIRLLCGATVSLRPASYVRAEMVNFTTGKKAAEPIKNAEKLLADDGAARFDDLKFPIGTRLKPVRLKWLMQVEISDGVNQSSCLVETEPSLPIIVLTNDNQWAEAEGILLRKRAFGSEVEIPWITLANHLQYAHLQATRQDPNQIADRPLNPADIDYFQRGRFHGKEMVSQGDFAKFWEWAGPFFQKLRFQRHLAKMWKDGLIGGFLSREETEHALAPNPPGSFLLRFSERWPGMFAVSYVTTEFKPKHYLIKDTDTAGNKKTLPDFLNDYKELTGILRIGFNSELGIRDFALLDKDSCLGGLYSRKEELSHTGYDDRINMSEADG